MRINRDLLPVKGFNFLFNAATAPILPSATIMAKNIGYSMTGIGILLTLNPLLTLVVKPICGSLADKFSLHKVIFIGTLLISATSIFSLQWFVHPSGSVLLRCSEGNLQVVFRRGDKLWNETYRDNVLSSINSSVFPCKVIPHKDAPMFANPFKESEPVNVELKLALNDLPQTIIMNASVPGISPSENCVRPPTETDPASLQCHDTVIQTLVDESSVYGLNWTQFFFAACLIATRVANSCTFTFWDTICLMKLGDRPQDFGFNRLFGALGWGASALIGGLLIDWYSNGKASVDYTLAFYATLVCNTLALFTGLSIAFEKTEKKSGLLADVKKAILGNHLFMLFLILSIFCGALSGFVWSYLIWYVEDMSKADPTADLSLMKTLEGLILFVQTYVGEIGFFLVSGWMVKRFGHSNCLSLVAFAFGMRFFLISYVPNAWWVLGIEVLNGITYATYITTSASFANAVAPEGTKTTIQAISSATFDIGTCFGIFFGGFAIDSWGGRFCFRAAGLGSLCLGVIYAGLSVCLS